MNCTAAHLRSRSLNIVSLSDMIEGSYRSWDLYTTGQKKKKRKKKKRKKENRFSLNGNGIMSSFLGRQFSRSTRYRVCLGFCCVVVLLSSQVNSRLGRPLVCRIDVFIGPAANLTNTFFLSLKLKEASHHHRHRHHHHELLARISLILSHHPSLPSIAPVGLPGYIPYRLRAAVDKF